MRGKAQPSVPSPCTCMCICVCVCTVHLSMCQKKDEGCVATRGSEEPFLLIKGVVGFTMPFEVHLRKLELGDCRLWCSWAGPGEGSVWPCVLAPMMRGASPSVPQVALLGPLEATFLCGDSPAWPALPPPSTSTNRAGGVAQKGPHAVPGAGRQPVRPPQPSFTFQLIINFSHGWGMSGSENLAEHAKTGAVNRLKPLHSAQELTQVRTPVCSASSCLSEDPAGTRRPWHQSGPSWTRHAWI